MDERKQAREGGREWREGERGIGTEREKSRSGMFFKFMSAPPQRQRSLALLGGRRGEERRRKSHIEPPTRYMNLAAASSPVSWTLQSKASPVSWRCRPEAAAPQSNAPPIRGVIMTLPSSSLLLHSHEYSTLPRSFSTLSPAITYKLSGEKESGGNMEWRGNGAG